MPYSLDSLANQFKLPYCGADELPIRGVCGVSDNLPDHLSFILDERHLQAAADSKISAFVARPGIELPGKALLYHDDPDYMIGQIAALFAPSQLDYPGIHPSAQIADSAVLAADVEIGANVVIGDKVRIGARTRVFPNVVIFDRVELGEDCLIYSNCTLREDSKLGDRVILQPGVTIGSDGYGYARIGTKHHKIPQLGRVVLEDDVEIGANSTVDRARFSETRIGSGSKLDNLVMIGHNVTTGEDCLLVAQVGVSGSTHLGDRVILAGQVGTVGHVNVADDVTVLGKGGVTKDVREPGVYAGMPLKPVRLWRRAIARLYSGLK